MSIINGDDPNFGVKVMKMFDECGDGNDSSNGTSSDEEVDHVEADDIIPNDTDEVEDEIIIQRGGIIIDAGRSSTLETNSRRQVGPTRKARRLVYTSEDSSISESEMHTDGGMLLGEFYVKELTKTLRGSNRNITVDNWFASVKLVDDLLKDKLTLVSTIRTKKPDIPHELLITKNRNIGSSMFCFDKEKTLVSFKAKSNKMVILLSTAHDQPTLNENTNKRHIIDDYNATKYGVDTLDEMCSNNSCSRKTRQRPLICVFYGMLNIGCLNSWAIYSHNNLPKKCARKSFLIQLSEELLKPWMMKRLQVVILQTNLRDLIEAVLGDNVPKQRQESTTNNKRTIFHICQSKKRRMTTSYCNQCERAYCKEHRANLCTKCCK
ncbi:hypothetical protein ANN_27769 [Periplaneta americana]|uniref:PiggyBac transposable element-derived protein domain-containing protein n=1 Tax=Periplaneta americana TaxID=6978 RepID=A0ABQ8RV30_PERAM|nr:hypothetical protein ANN_27769 [Periplaneta americana]